MVGLPWVLPQWDVGAGHITTVVEIDTVLGPTACLAIDVVDRTSVVVAFQEEVALEGIARISLIDFCATEQNDILEVRPSAHSSWFLHRRPNDVLVTDFRELCSGLGALGRGACAAGFRVVGVNELQTRTAEVAAQVTGCSVAVGDICSNAVLVQLWNEFPREAGITAGFSCQPFSGLGDRKGRSDSRSRSLVGVLRASFLLQAPWTLLECVAPAGKDEFVVECIEGYCASLGCRWETVELDLRDVWPANRKRWWCLITPTSRPPVQLQAWQPSGPWRSVADVLQTPQEDEQAQQMMLTAMELEEFQARKPLVSFLLRSGAALPTALHSWGAQIYSCPCGCRPFPFKPSRLDDKLCAVLLRVQTPEGLRFRHLTPHEAAFLNGLSPETYFGSDMRLALTLVGQLASPLQSCWVLASMRVKHGSVLPGMQPAQLLWKQRLDLLEAAARCGLRCQVPALVDVPTQQDAPQEAGILFGVSAEGDAQHDLCRGLSVSDTRVGSFTCAAEAPIAPTEVESKSCAARARIFASPAKPALSPPASQGDPDTFGGTSPVGLPPSTPGGLPQAWPPACSGTTRVGLPPSAAAALPVLPALMPQSGEGSLDSGIRVGFHHGAAKDQPVWLAASPHTCLTLANDAAHEGLFHDAVGSSPAWPPSLHHASSEVQSVEARCVALQGAVGSFEKVGSTTCVGRTHGFVDASRPFAAATVDRLPSSNGPEVIESSGDSDHTSQRVHAGEGDAASTVGLNTPPCTAERPGSVALPLNFAAVRFGLEEASRVGLPPGLLAPASCTQDSSRESFVFPDGLQDRRASHDGVPLLSSFGLLSQAEGSLQAEQGVAAHVAGHAGHALSVGGSPLDVSLPHAFAGNAHAFPPTRPPSKDGLVCAASGVLSLDQDCLSPLALDFGRSPTRSSASVQMSMTMDVADILQKATAQTSRPAWRVRNAAGQVLEMGAAVERGCTVLIDFAVAPEHDALLATVMPDVAHSLVQAKGPTEVRKAIADGLGHWLTDDLMADGLECLSRHRSGSSVWTDPVVLTAAWQALASRSLPSVDLREGTSIVAACALQGHWVTFCWQKLAGFVHAWCSVNGTFLANEVSQVHWLFSKVAGEPLGRFRFKDAGPRHALPGLCGTTALLDLRAFLLRHAPCNAADVLRVAAIEHQRLLGKLHTPGLIRMPCIVAGVVGAMLEQGLCSLLKTKGVPAGAAPSRARDLIQKAGQAQVQQAMVSSQPWRQLKAICSNLVPSFQIVLPDELQAQITSRLQAGEEVGPKKRGRKEPRGGKTPGAPITGPPLLPAPETLEIPEGVFEANGVKLPQVTLQQLGPHAKGVALSTAAQAGPYLGLTKPMSREPLGLLVLGALPAEGVSVGSTEVKFQAKWKLSGDPLLLTATLLQLGTPAVVKHEPSVRTPVEVLPSALVRLGVFRDEFPHPWDEFRQAPLRAVIAECPLLSACHKLGCDCPAFHGVSSGDAPEPILEVFGRQYLTLNLRPSSPESAQLFNAVLRVPRQLEEAIQGSSGVKGIYFEPRGDTLQEVSTRFSVIWLPRTDLQQAVVLKQSNKAALGICRIGDRYGLRCHSSAAEDLHRVLKPDRPYIAPATMTRYHVGPWPAGTQRSVVCKTLAAFGWTALASQPVAGAGPGGPWWQVQAGIPPPAEVIPSEVGDILIVPQVPKQGVRKPAAPVVASREVLRQMQTGPPVAVESAVFAQAGAATANRRSARGC